jgi:hypothetical protein
MTARRINDTRPMSGRGLDPFPTPPCATQALLRIENIPDHSLVYDLSGSDAKVCDAHLQDLIRFHGFGGKSAAGRRRTVTPVPVLRKGAPK